MAIAECIPATACIFLNKTVREKKTKNEKILFNLLNCSFTRIYIWNIKNGRGKMDILFSCTTLKWVYDTITTWFIYVEWNFYGKIYSFEVRRIYVAAVQIQQCRIQNYMHDTHLQNTKVIFKCKGCKITVGQPSQGRDKARELSPFCRDAST